MTDALPPHFKPLAGEPDPRAQAIGVFDSGVGGLSVLLALRKELPLERFVYIADSGHAPYGERHDAHVIDRSRAIARYLVAHHRVKALVVACNTATSAAIRLLRQDFPDIPIIGIEPALKPAAALSKTRRIGVMATRGTLQSEKFGALLASLQDQATFILQPCDGLASAIERSDAIKTIASCAYSTRAMGQFGSDPDNIDTLVLGCTHYPFASDELRTLVGDHVTFVECGTPVARQARRLLAANNWLMQEELPGVEPVEPAHPIYFGTTGNAQVLQAAALRWLKLDIDAHALKIN